MRAFLLLLLAACSACSGASADRAQPPAARRVVLHDVRLAGGDGRAIDVELDGARIAAVRPSGIPDKGVQVIDEHGAYLAPAFVDSHVHVAYQARGGEPVAQELAARGVIAAVDLGAPLDTLGRPTGALRLLAAGPMLTAPGGYPLSSWGRDGYGLGVADGVEAAEAVDRLAGAGARVIKLAVMKRPPRLDDARLAAAVKRAHEKGLKVAAHALEDEAARRAAAAGVDVLAHTPVEPLAEETVAAWRGRTVISTLGAFGGEEPTLANLRRLRAAGVRVLYGTDLGNTQTVAIDGDEVALLVKAGLGGGDILVAGTSAPADTWGFTDVGKIEPGRSASLLLWHADPAADPTRIAHPDEVWVDGRKP